MDVPDMGYWQSEYLNSEIQLNRNAIKMLFITTWIV